MCTDLADKVQGGGKLGKKGERRFAPRMGRQGHMKKIEPSRYGDLWLRIPVTPTDMIQEYTDQNGLKRVSFIFTHQLTFVKKAYSLLTTDSESD